MITLKEAIEEQRDMLYRRTISLSEKQKDALEQSTEALERVLSYRKGIYIFQGEKLPGEAKE